jgi:hypothetical protein
MKLYQGVLVVTMLGAALAVGCNNSTAADNSTADTAATPVSDTDTATETATTAPPAPQAENPGTPPNVGDVYVQGAWRYTGGHYVWGRGRWERSRSGVVLVQPRWVEANGKWEHHPARYTHARAGEEHPTEHGEARAAEGHPGEGHPNEAHPAARAGEEHPRPAEHR